MSLPASFNFILFCAMRFIRYSRKSSEGDERQIQSIPDQNAVLDRLAIQQGLTISHTLEEARSAKKPGIRPVFAEVLRLIQEGKADGILCWHLNRLTRNPVDSGTLSWLLQEGIIRSIKTPEREYRPEDNVVIMAVENAVSNQFIVDLRRNIRRAQLEKAARGWYPHKPPGGYFTNRETREIQVDTDQFVMLRKAWDLMLTGVYSVPEVHAKLKSWGYRTRLGGGKSGQMITRSNLYQLFDHRFYLGEFSFLGKSYEGRHRPMVTREEFAQVQGFIHGRSPSEPKRHVFAYTGLIRCGGCGCMVTAERKIKRYPTTNRTVTYVYYHCTRSKHCTEPAVTESYVEQVIAGKLAKCNLNAEAVQWAKSALEGGDVRPDQGLPYRRKQLEQELDGARAKLSNLYDLRLSGEISATELQTLKARYQGEVRRLEEFNERLRRFAERGRQTTEHLLTFVATANDLFRDGNDKVKRQIARLLADHYLLTLGELKIQPHPLLEPLITLEPPKRRRHKVRPVRSGPENPIWFTWVDHIRTLLTTQDVSFGKLGDEEQVQKIATQKDAVAPMKPDGRMKRKRRRGKPSSSVVA
jgi:site-specific DNA recombinase